MKHNYSQKSGGKCVSPERLQLVFPPFHILSRKGNVSIILQRGLFSAYVLIALTFASFQAYGQTNCASVTPTATNDGNIHVLPGVSTSISAAALLANDGPTGSNLVIQSVSHPSNGSLVLRDGNLVYTPKPGYRGPDEFTYTVKRNGDATGIIPFNGHYYEFVLVGDVGITWRNAKAAAESKSFNGLQGYLANITSAQENEFIRSRVNLLYNGGRAWIGASDDGHESEWKWKGGPEEGTVFYNHATPRPEAQPGYSNWLNNDGSGNLEPNNAFGIEHFAYMLGFNGEWNDLTNEIINGHPVQMYTIEYGTGQNCAMTATATVKLIINSGSVASSNSTGRQVAMNNSFQNQLHQNYPNPFTSSTKVNFTVHTSGFTSLKVHNVLGQEVKTLFAGQADAGNLYETTFELAQLPKGVYFYTLVNGPEKITKRMLVE